MQVRRFDDNPIIVPHMDERMGDNINGPSLIRVPDWVESPLGKYYLYFAHHQGTYIRMAYADALEGPWTIHVPGVLDMKDAFWGSHIASPDIHILDDQREIRMYYHGCCIDEPPYQMTHLAVSRDGLTFTANPERLGSSYWRAFRWQDHWYTLEMPGVFRRSLTGVTGFEEGPTLFTVDMRHSAVLLRGTALHVFFSNAYDCPECILHSRIDLESDWMVWEATEPVTLLAPDCDYEGADRPLDPSERGSVHERVRQLRDPGIFEEDGKTYLLYSVAGEYGLAIAELALD